LKKVVHLHHNTKANDMTTQDLNNSRIEIEERYNELGGLEFMFNEFFNILVEAAEVGLNETDNTSDLVDIMFTSRFAGITEKNSQLRETMGKIAMRNENNGKTWNPLTSKWE
jgi:hypothetical protein